MARASLTRGMAKSGMLGGLLPTAILLAGAMLAGVVLAALLLSTGCGETPSGNLRPFHPESRRGPVVHAVCYGPHRDGQRPGEADPTADQLREDLHLMQPHWNLLRVYGADAVAANLLEIIRAEGLDLKVVLGVWIAPEAPAANAAQVAEAVRLTAAYPDVVVAVAVGNETQVSWSAHRSPLAGLIEHVRQVRAQVGVPVTVADDFNFWNKPESVPLARELDFLLVHAHPLWNGLQLEGALPWLQEQLAAVQERHPDRLLVLGETGWATSVADQDEQATLIKGRAGQAEQKVFHDQVRAWAASTGRIVFFFEAFDENWKGGPLPEEVEKHWGVFRADRTPKAAVDPQM